MKANFELNEMLGIMVYMISEMIGKLKKNKAVMIGTFLALALGVSALIAGGVMYLTSYGTDISAAAMAAEPVIQGNAIELPSATATAETTPTQAVIVLNVPAGAWTEEACTEAGKQMNAEMASFWTDPQGVGCNVLSNGTWIALP